MHKIFHVEKNTLYYFSKFQQYNVNLIMKIPQKDNLNHIRLEILLTLSKKIFYFNIFATSIYY